MPERSNFKYSFIPPPEAGKVIIPQFYLKWTELKINHEFFSNYGFPGTSPVVSRALRALP